MHTLATGRAIAYRQRADLILLTPLLENFLCLLILILRRGRIDGGMGEHLAGLVDRGNFTAGAITGIDTQHATLTGGRREQHRAQVLREYRDRLSLGATRL